MIDQDRQIYRTIMTMEEGVDYLLSEKVWETYQAERIKRGWGRWSSREEWVFRRTGTALSLNGESVDYSSACDLAFAFTLTPLAFAFTDGAFAFAFAFAASSFAFDRADGSSPKDNPVLRSHSFDDIRQINSEIKGDHDGYYYETPAYALAGSVDRDETHSVHFHGLSKELAAELILIVKGRMG